MFDWRSRHEWARLLRYYQAGLLNTAFGYGLYAALIVMGLNPYIAQIIAHTGGAMFNYVTYSKFAFRDGQASLVRYMGAYAAQYLLSLGVLAAGITMGASPYLAGLISIIIVSAINYFLLKIFVYRAGQGQ